MAYRIIDTPPTEILPPNRPTRNRDQRQEASSFTLYGI